MKGFPGISVDGDSSTVDDDFIEDMRFNRVFGEAYQMSHAPGSPTILVRRDCFSDPRQQLCHKMQCRSWNRVLCASPKVTW